MHNFSDVLALVVAYVANRLAKRPTSDAHTFGYKRAEILAALFNASVLIGIAIFLIIESIHKLLHPESIESFWVIGLGLLSIVLNTLSVLLVKSGAEENMNIKAAYLHLLTDVMTSIAVVVGGVLMYYLQWFWVDPLVSMLIAFYLITASWSLVRSSAAVLMQFTPKELQAQSIQELILKEPSLKGVHHMHLWRLNDHAVHCEAHLEFKEDVKLSVCNEVINRLEALLYERFGITHLTFQCEYERDDDKALIV